MPEQIILDLGTVTNNSGNLNKASWVSGLVVAAALGLNFGCANASTSSLVSRAVPSASIAKAFADPYSHRKRKNGFASPSSSLEVVLDNTNNSDQISSISLTNDHMSTLIKRADSFFGLAEGWDGYDADAPDKDAIYNTISFLKSIPSAFTSHLSEYSLVPTNYGTITVEWSNDDDNFVSVEIGYDQIAYFYEIHGESWASEENYKVKSDNYTDGIISALSRLYSHSIA